LAWLAVLPAPNALPLKAPPPPKALPGFGFPNAPLETAPKAPNPLAGLTNTGSEKLEGDGVEIWFAGWSGGSGRGAGEPNIPPTGLFWVSDCEVELPRDRPPNEGASSPIETDGVEDSGGADGGGLLWAPNPPPELNPPPEDELKVFLVDAKAPNPPDALVPNPPEALFEEPNAEAAAGCAPNELCPNAGCCPNVD
jgi:hypothetical protein